MASLRSLYFIFVILLFASRALSRCYHRVSYHLANQLASQPAQPWLEGRAPIGVGEVAQCCTVQECTALSVWGLHLENLPNILAWH